MFVLTEIARTATLAPAENWSCCRQLCSSLYHNSVGLTSRGRTFPRLSAASQGQNDEPGACDLVLKVSGRKGKKERQTARGTGPGRRRRSALSLISEQLDGFVLTVQEELLKHHHPKTHPSPHPRSKASARKRAHTSTARRQKE